ncbi:MAG TPA: hypothetical protein VFZ21_25165 [Gemmatimonadaceae bacterium]|jgi:hypothetical protein|nr:hypothetical protein [Gemmatimonadaceae bacterium]
MGFAKQFAHSYHDGSLVAASVGPRREVSLVIRLDPVWNDGVDKECTVRLGAIQNFDDVAAFVRTLQTPARSDAYIDQVVHLRWTAGGNVRLELATHGFVEISRPKVVEI